MTLDKSCPGSRTIRNPIPESIPCPNCGREVEIWTDELKATCPNCKNKVLRERQASCIDWCPYAKECVGPEVYERLKPGLKEDLSGTPLDILKREHDRILENLGLLRGVSLCLKFGTLGTGSPLRDRGLNHLGKVKEFFDKDVRLHFRCEEEVLFPVFNKRLGGERNPTRLLLREHEEWKQWFQRLKEVAAKLEAGVTENTEILSAEVQEINGRIERLLREHIKKENELLLPVVQSLFNEAELEEISQKWRLLTNEVISEKKEA
jgi:hemerythrin-like domain-containing protein